MIKLLMCYLSMNGMIFTVEALHKTMYQMPAESRQVLEVHILGMLSLRVSHLHQKVVQSTAILYL